MPEEQLDNLINVEPCYAIFNSVTVVSYYIYMWKKIRVKVKLINFTGDLY